MKAYTLGEKTREIVKRIKALLAPEKSGPERARHLELIGSILFLIRTGQAKPIEENRLSEILKANGKAFEPNDAKEAVVSLKRYGYAL